MANIHPEIKPNAVQDKYLIDLMYMLQASLKGLCTKLDADAGVPLTTYLANCYTALMHTRITDYRGNMSSGEEVIDHIITPQGLAPSALIQWIYDWVNAFETLTEQLDTDVLTDSNYESLCYYACILPYMFESGRYDQTTMLGNDNISGGFSATPDAYAPWLAVKIGPVGKPHDKILCDLFYDLINAWETLCEKLDADGTVTDTDYEALWYTATVLMRVENCQGNVLGNDQTRL